MLSIVCHEARSSQLAIVRCVLAMVFFLVSLPLAMAHPAPSPHNQSEQQGKAVQRMSVEPAVEKAQSVSSSSQKSSEATVSSALKPVGSAGVSSLEQPGVKETKAVVHYALSDFYFNRWKLELSEIELEEAILYWPNFEAAHRRLCVVSLLRGNFARSLAELMMGAGLGEAIPLNDDERATLNKRALVLHYNRGVDEGRVGNWRDAVAEFKWALTYGPAEAIVHRSLAFAFASLGDFYKAEQQYQLSIEFDPTDAFAHADFAFLLADRGEHDRAARQISEAVRRNPSVAALHVDMGWMAESRGDLNTAGREFQKAVVLSPTHAWIWTHLGKILEQQGKSSEAVDAYNKAVTIDPNEEEARQRLVKLKPQANS